MKKTIKRLERFRICSGRMASKPSDGRNGMFQLPGKLFGNTREVMTVMTVMCSDASDWPREMGPQKWEHVSCSFPHRCPTWDELCVVKNLFWDAHECVVQFHPPEREYVNHHRYCLHLWKPIGIELPLPPAFAVGPRTEQ